MCISHPLSLSRAFPLSLSLSLPLSLSLISALPEIISSTPSPVITVTGRSEHLDCFADGSPLQNVSWTFTNASGVPLFEIGFLIDNDTARTGYTEYVPLVEDINELYIMERFSISNNTVPSAMEYGRLSIADINAFDAGMYNCTLTNIYNLMDPNTYSVQVQVQRKHFILFIYYYCYCYCYCYLLFVIIKD